VVEPQIRKHVIEIHNAQPSWAEFEKALLVEYMLEDALMLTRHALIN
jgi:hypothetical protein